MVQKYCDKHCGSYRILFVTPKRLLETHIFLKNKEGSLSSEKNVLAYFARSFEHDKYQGTLHQGPQGVLTLTVEVIRSIL